VKQLSDPAKAFETILGLITRLAQHGLIHCDFNKFNLMVWIHVFSRFPGVDMHARTVILLKYI
jgi:RIO-like serine/threonine protein kinase